MTNSNQELVEPVIALPPTNKQKLFARYLMAILLDLTVLNLFAQYWDRVVVDSFSTSILVAILLQVLLQLTFKVEHKTAAYFNAKSGIGATIGRYLSAWTILFASKLIILGIIDYAFGDSIIFHGNYHGALAFIVVIVVMLAAEEVMTRFFRSLE